MVVSRRAVALLLLVSWLLASSPEPAAGYVGPGAGLTVIGAAIALVAGIFFWIFGFVWYPVKRLLRRRSTEGEAA